MAETQPTILGGTAIKPKERHGWEAVRYMIHNPETGEFFTRTPKSWALITIFYIIYYSCLAGFWAAMLNIFFLTLEDDKPKWMTTESLIGNSPGVGLAPGQIPELIDSSMIAFNYESEQDQGTPGSANYVAGWGGWVARNKEFLKPYQEKLGRRGKSCDDSDTGCFALSNLGKCAEGNYGYDSGEPCIFLKLNRIYGNENDPYTKSEEDLKLAKEKGMPQTLIDHIKEQNDVDQVWIECHGEYAADKEMLKPANIEYFPKSAGFPAKYFPYKNQDGYQSPVVAVKFKGLKDKPQLLHIECRAWAKNIDYNKRDRIGLSHMELLILNDQASGEVGS